MYEAECLTQTSKKCVNYIEKCKKRQQALRYLYNYINQLKIHFDLSEKDIIKLLKHILKMKSKNNFFKKIWNIFKLKVKIIKK